MELLEVLEGKQRDYALEKEILLQFSKILKSYISMGDIKNTLEQNGFNGIYLLDKSVYSNIDVPSDTMGIYNGDNKIIVMCKECYYSDQKIGIHEMGHAFLDGRNESKVFVDGIEIRYGKGLEEGALSLLMCTKNISDIGKYDPTIYPWQSILFQQLSVLYNYSNLKEYPNLLVDMFMRPENFISLIRNIYVDIFKENFSKVDLSIVTKSAFDMIEGTDLLTTCDKYNRKLFDLLQFINSLYLNVADRYIRSTARKNAKFPDYKLLFRTKEETLMYNLFGVEEGYMYRQEQNLESLLMLFQEEVENLPDDKTKTMSL